MGLMARVRGVVRSVLGPDLTLAVRARWAEIRCGFTFKQISDGRIRYLQVGSGGNDIDGFCSVDMYPRGRAIRANIASRLPFDSGTFDGVFAEHVFEHLDYAVGVPRFLAECRRVLSPGGHLRLVVPDAGEYLTAYAQGGWQKLSAMRPLDDQQRDRWLDDRYRTRMELINAVFRQGSEHRYAYDAETMIMVLEDAGFVDVRQRVFGEGADTNLVIDSPERASESLYVEGRNP